MAETVSLIHDVYSIPYKLYDILWSISNETGIGRLDRVNQTQVHRLN